MKARILVVDNEQRMCMLIKQSLELEEYSVEMAFSGQDAINTLNTEKFDIVITDLKMQPIDGLQVLKHTKETTPATEVILITAFATQETALDAMKSGAYDYLIKPFKMDELIIRLERIIKQNEILKENERLKAKHAEPAYLAGIIGKSKKMRDVFDLIKRVSKQDAAVLIRGESGTGKELVARAIHEESDRYGQEMISVNCAALPETLLESELFGYEKGAFTGADKQKKGLFELADKSTLFLDEIGDLSLNLQAKLLRVLQNKEIIRLGGHEAVHVDVRLITATHRDIEQMIRDQQFRNDLYYRINLFPIHLPPLRDRKEDIPELIEHFMQKFPDKMISTTAKLALMEYDYPGNVRELENIIARGAIVAENVIEEVNIKLPQPLPDTTVNHFGQLPQDGIKLDDHIRGLLKQALQKAEGNKSRAAELLGITRRRLYSMLETHNLH